MIWVIAYTGAVLAVIALCWGRGFGYRRASFILALNLAAQVGCQLVLGTKAPSFIWMWLDLVTALFIVRCPWAGRTHSIVATILAFQVLIHLAYWARGNPMIERALYLDVTGSLGWAQLALLVGGAWYGPLQRTWMAWIVGRRLSGAVARHQSGMDARQ